MSLINSLQKMLILWILFIFPLALVKAESLQAQLPMLESEAPSAKTSYEARILNAKMVHDQDPNVYAYTAEFARRFQMPEKWITPDLQGAAAVAFRVVPGYVSCGWGGNPESCNAREVRCMMDVYFDHEKHPLPWDKRKRIAELDHYWNSSFFLGSLANPYARPKRPFGTGPFVHPVTGKEMGWQEWMGGRGEGVVGIRAYDREVFKGMSLIILGASCTGASSKELWLASEIVNRKDVATSSAVRHVVRLPESWQQRVKEAAKSAAQRNDAHFKKVYEDLKKSGALEAE